MFYKTGDCFINNFDFLKRSFGALHGFLIYQLNEEISTHKAVKEQIEIIFNIEELIDFISLEEKIAANKNAQSIKRKQKHKDNFSAEMHKNCMIK